MYATLTMIYWYNSTAATYTRTHAWVRVHFGAAKRHIVSRSFFRSVLTALYVPMWYSSCLSSLTVPVPDSIRCLSFCQVKVEHFFFSFFFFSTMFNLYTCIFFFLLFFPGVISKYPSMYPNRFLFADYITFKLVKKKTILLYHYASSYFIFSLITTNKYKNK